ncbi:MAG TPA: helix-hairpin-helix domain-containing protein [Gemmataceae bacterium]|nr:helix-hairpin-helix domain-containing protein [Gemmataceae bacterium]
MPKNRANCACLEDLPNIGRSIAADLRRLGIRRPEELVGRDPYAMYDELCRISGQRHDPCLLDTFIAAVRFMEGAPKK